MVCTRPRLLQSTVSHVDMVGKSKAPPRARFGARMAWYDLCVCSTRASWEPEESCADFRFTRPPANEFSDETVGFTSLSTVGISSIVTSQTVSATKDRWGLSSTQRLSSTQHS
ncbi:MAG: hypothetical protein ACPIOQ_17735 [Promethearchaeia archaeon]